MTVEHTSNRFPKVELHLHLDCSLSLESVSRLVPDMTAERYRHEFLAPEKCQDLVDYFRYLVRPQALLQTTHGLRIAVMDVFRQLVEDGVIYAEIRFAPHLHMDQGLTAEEVVEAVLTAREAARTVYPVETRLILCTLRHFDTALGMEVVAMADKYRTRGVGGIDLAGDEAGHSLDAHVPVFRRAMDLGVSSTAHAGEAAGAESVREVVDRLGVRRVGHGIRAMEDNSVLDMLMERGVHLEVCPSCNVQIGVVQTLADHPIHALTRMGISTGINTDARGPTALTLGIEYQRMSDTFGWTDVSFKAANLRALDAAFLDDISRSELIDRLG